MNKFIALFLALVVTGWVTVASAAEIKFVDYAYVPFICSDINSAFLIAEANKNSEELMVQEMEKAVAEKSCYNLAYNVRVVLDQLILDYVDYDGEITELWLIKSDTEDDWYVFTYN